MKATINVEFTDDELRKYGEDVARRVGLNFIRDTVKAVQKVKFSPGLGTVLEQVLSGAISSKLPADPGPTASPPDVPHASNEKFERCQRVEESPYNEESWICCECVAMNWASRNACRICGHKRCDVVVPPPPMSDPNVS